VKIPQAVPVAAVPSPRRSGFTQAVASEISGRSRERLNRVRRGRCFVRKAVCVWYGAVLSWPSQTSICDASSCANPNRQPLPDAFTSTFVWGARAHLVALIPAVGMAHSGRRPMAPSSPVGGWSWNSASALARSPAFRRRRVRPSRHVSQPGTRARRHRQAIAPVDLERLLGAAERRQESDRPEARRADHLARIP